jgi:hypothetical protein
MTYRKWILLTATVAFIGPASAEDSPTPRRPIGPQGRTMELQTPSQENIPVSPQPVPADSIRIQNVGDQQLFISYWDPDSSWRTISVDAGRPVEVSCRKCAGQFTVAFHNGKEPKQTKLAAGGSYVLGWSEQGGVWILTPSAGR